MLKEKDVEAILRAYLVRKGWTLTNEQKTAGQHGCDIEAWRKSWNKRMLIEVKGDGKAEVQTKHNAFYTLFGQILSRMDIQGNHNNKARIYAIAIPAHWEKTFKQKISKLVFGWRLLKLRVFLVSDSDVVEKSYSYFLKK
jgi:hypothetical protein